MAQQIKKKYLSSEVISYFDDQIDAVELSLSQEVQNRIDGDSNVLSSAENYTDSEVGAAITQLQGEISSGDAATLSSANSYTDGEISTEAAARVAGDSALQSSIDVEKGRIDAILLAADADKDSFAEIVTLINSIDTTNDQAFAGYVLSNDAAVAAVEGRVTTAEGEIDALQSDVADHETRITTLESALAPVWAPAFKKDLDATDISNGYINLPDLVVPNSVIAFVDRLAIHETEEFTLSTVGGVTRITFTGPLVSPGQQSLDANDNIYVKYQILA